MAAATSTMTSTKERLGSVDLLRGVVMVVMALDHVRDFFTNVPFDPTDLDKTSVGLFFTRWITHFCAPVFVFLAGTGAFLSSKKKPELARFLVTRGLWLIVLELTWVGFAWSFRVEPSFALQVIWVIGVSMIVLAPLVFLPTRAVLAIGLVIISAHNALDGIDPSALGSAAKVWQLLHVQGPIRLFGIRGFVVYPLVPWIGVMMVGYAFGEVLQRERATRHKRLYAIGGALILLFVVLRAIDVYGDPHHWHAQRNAAMSVVAFLNCTKYPPSLLYLCMTLGPAIALLPLLERARGALSDWLTTFGRVPLFYYVLHVPLIHLAAVGVAFVQYGTAVNIAPSFVDAPPAGWGYALPGVYAIWALVVLALYPACRWFAGVKQRRRDAWLSYL
jgi:uncharacterized membrane protein